MIVAYLFLTIQIRLTRIQTRWASAYAQHSVIILILILAYSAGIHCPSFINIIIIP